MSKLDASEADKVLNSDSEGVHLVTPKTVIESGTIVSACTDESFSLGAVERLGRVDMTYHLNRSEGFEGPIDDADDIDTCWAAGGSRVGVDAHGEEFVECRTIAETGDFVRVVGGVEMGNLVSVRGKRLVSIPVADVQTSVTPGEVYVFESAAVSDESRVLTAGLVGAVSVGGEIASRAEGFNEDVFRAYKDFTELPAEWTVWAMDGAWVESAASCAAIYRVV